MSYQVLARKWRPHTFNDLVGQEHVVQALVNGLDQDRVHHAFLLTGTRGVGKTTIARILAKCLNCEQGVSSTPCGECGSCIDVDDGRFVDMMEIDAASKTKVDDTRELLETVQYTPSRGRYKVYIIDEVHMLSGHSFNALLKTLEEPPPHVKFVLATTDPQKLPITILSRCLRFSLTRLLPDQISGHLSKILQSESIEAEESAIMRIARAADGSMRDSLSLLDQAIAFGGGSLKDADVASMLGSIDHVHIAAIVDALAREDAGALLDIVNELVMQSRNLESALDELAEAMHRIALIHAAPGFRDPERHDWESLVERAGRISPEDAQLYYQIAITGRRDLGLAPDPRTGLEMTLLRMLAFKPAEPGSEALKKKPEKSTGGVVDTPPTQSLSGSTAEPDGLSVAAPANQSSVAGGGNAAARAARAAFDAMQQSASSRPAKAPEPALESSVEAERKPVPRPKPQSNLQAEPPEASRTEPQAEPQLTSQPEPQKAPGPEYQQEPPWELYSEPEFSFSTGSVSEPHHSPEPMSQPGRNPGPDPLSASRPVGGSESTSRPGQAPATRGSEGGPVSTGETAAVAELNETVQDWSKLQATLELSGVAREFARNLQLESTERNHWRFLVPHSLEHLGSDSVVQSLQSALCSHLGHAIELDLHTATEPVKSVAAATERAKVKRMSDAERSIDEDVTVQDIKNKFGASVVPDSIQPLQ